MGKPKFTPKELLAVVAYLEHAFFEHKTAHLVNTEKEIADFANVTVATVKSAYKLMHKYGIVNENDEIDSAYILRKSEKNKKHKLMKILSMSNDEIIEYLHKTVNAQKAYIIESTVDMEDINMSSIWQVWEINFENYSVKEYIGNTTMKDFKKWIIKAESKDVTDDFDIIRLAMIAKPTKKMKAGYIGTYLMA